MNNQTPLMTISTTFDMTSRRNLASHAVWRDTSAVDRVGSFARAPKKTARSEACSRRVANHLAYSFHVSLPRAMREAMTGGFQYAMKRG
jgi:hypothetical protein